MTAYGGRSILEPAPSFGLVREEAPSGSTIRLVDGTASGAWAEISIREGGADELTGTEVDWGVSGFSSTAGGRHSFTTPIGFGRVLTVVSVGVKGEFEDFVRSIPATGSPELFNSDASTSPIMELPTQRLAAAWFDTSRNSISFDVGRQMVGEAPLVDIRAQEGPVWSLLGVADAEANCLRSYALTAHDPRILDDDSCPSFTVFGEKPTGRSQVMWKANRRFWHLFSARGLEYTIPCAARIQATLREGVLT